MRAHYKALADDVKAQLMEQHPDYRYSPRKPGEKKRRNKKRALSDLGQVEGSLHEGRLITLPSFTKQGFNKLRHQEKQHAAGISASFEGNTTAMIAPATISARDADFLMLK